MPCRYAKIINVIGLFKEKCGHPSHKIKSKPSFSLLSKYFSVFSVEFLRFLLAAHIAYPSKKSNENQ
jgi:hypothetical protein